LFIYVFFCYAIHCIFYSELINLEVAKSCFITTIFKQACRRKHSNQKVTAELLQTSSKSAVETTELTRSFGWDSSEAWQQHDIQELCRVMFDALEQKFKHTDQADLIQRLYEGKIMLENLLTMTIAGQNMHVYSYIFIFHINIKKWDRSRCRYFKKVVVDLTFPFNFHKLEHSL
jgi:hypothetical protein